VLNALSSGQVFETPGTLDKLENLIWCGELHLPWQQGLDSGRVGAVSYTRSKYLVNKFAVEGTMNLAENPTEAELRLLMRLANDDAAHHMLWVGNDGEVHIDPLPENVSPVAYAETKQSEMRFRFETLDRGNSYVGYEASQDEQWVSRLYRALTRSWASGVHGYSDEI
jgi:hypothetical protein